MDDNIEVFKLKDKMNQKIFIIPRETFCWLNDNSVLVISVNDDWRDGHCAILNLVIRQKSI